MGYRSKDYKAFEKKPNPPYTKPIPVMSFRRANDLSQASVEVMSEDEYRERMQRVADWHQFQIDNTNPNDPIFARNIPRHVQIYGDIVNERAKVAYGD